jgi:hypothetical protein
MGLKLVEGERETTAFLESPVHLAGNIQELEKSVVLAVSAVSMLTRSKLVGQYKLGLLLMQLKKECKKPENSKHCSFEDLLKNISIM